MFKSFNVESKVRGNYSVNFIDNLNLHILDQTTKTNIVFVIDKKVYDLYKSIFKKVTSKARFVLITCNEQNKTLDYAQEVIRKLIKQNIRKDDSVIAVGGGITQDIVAFISSILFRGIDWKFYPTTLLAQCDSCIGSKSSINFDQFKNLLGTFNPPSDIYLYRGFLETLSESEIKSGIGEMLHYFLNEGIALAKEISDEYDNILNDRSLLNYFIENSLRIKKQTIEIDEFDTSIRHNFNYGHTFGHAIEAITNYSIPHGQAVTIGMDIANYISFKKGLLKKEEFQKIHLILKKNIPPFKITIDNIESYCIALARDKKNKGNKLGSILCKGVGSIDKVFIEMDHSLKEILLEYSLYFGI